MVQADRLPPHQIQAEEGVLGSILIDEAALELVLGANLDASHFYRQRNRIVFDAFLRMRRKAIAIDMATTAAEIETNLADFEEVGGSAYLAHLMATVPTSMHAAHYAQIVRTHALQRQALSVASDIAERAHTGESPEDIGQALIKAGLEISSNEMRGSLVRASESSSTVFENVLARYTQKEVEGDIFTGFTSIDVNTGPMIRGNLVIVGARTSIGKSEFAFHLIRNAELAGVQPALFSAEMSEEEIVLRWVANETGVSVLQARKMTDEARRELEPKIVDALGKFGDGKVLLTDSPSLTSDDVRAQCLSWVRSGRKIDLVVVDYLQRLRDPLLKGESNTNRIGRMTETLKSLASEIDAVVIALSQLSRVDKNSQRVKEPTLEDLRDSGNIEQDADRVLLLHSIDYYMRRGYAGYRGPLYFPEMRDGQKEYNKAAQNILFVNVAKNRMGPTWPAKIYYDPERSFMRDLYEQAHQGEMTTRKTY